MSGGELHVGVVGASISGGWALESHIPALQALPYAALSAISTTREQTARATAEAFGGAHPHSSARDLARDPSVRLVTVAVKVPDHDDAVVAAIDAHKDVYCEWPLSTDTARARALRDLAVARGVRHVIGLQARMAPEVRHLRRLVLDGFVGRVLSVRASSAGWGLGGDVIPPNREWAMDRQNGLSALTVRAAHTVDAMEFCTTPITRLSAEVAVATPRPLIGGTGRHADKTAPDQVVLTGLLDGGATFSAHVLLGVRPPRTPLLAVMGTRGTLSIETADPQGQIQMSALRLIAQREDDLPEHVPVGSEADGLVGIPQGSAYAVGHLYAAIAGRHNGAESTPPSFDDAVRLHHLVDTIERAATTGVRQHVTGE